MINIKIVDQSRRYATASRLYRQTAQLWCLCHGTGVVLLILYEVVPYKYIHFNLLVHAPLPQQYESVAHHGLACIRQQRHNIQDRYEGRCAGLYLHTASSHTVMFNSTCSFGIRHNDHHPTTHNIHTGTKQKPCSKSSQPLSFSNRVTASPKH